MLNYSTVCAANVLQADGVIVHYTDTIVGLACLPKEELLQRLADIKRRSQQQGFILLAAAFQQIQQFVNCSTSQLNTLNSVQEKPTTWLVNASDQVPPSLIGSNNKLAVRLSSHNEIMQLCDRVGAIASTSANLNGQIVCSQLHQTRKMFGPQIDFVHVTKKFGTEQASTIIDMESGNIVR